MASVNIPAAAVAVSLTLAGLRAGEGSAAPLADGSERRAGFPTPGERG